MAAALLVNGLATLSTGQKTKGAILLMILKAIDRFFFNYPITLPTDLAAFISGLCGIIEQETTGLLIGAWAFTSAQRNLIKQTRITAYFFRQRVITGQLSQDCTQVTLWLRKSDLAYLLHGLDCLKNSNQLAPYEQQERYHLSDAIKAITQLAPN